MKFTESVEIASPTRRTRTSEQMLLLVALGGASAFQATPSASLRAVSVPRHVAPLLCSSPNGPDDSKEETGDIGDIQEELQEDFV